MSNKHSDSFQSSVNESSVKEKDNSLSSKINNNEEAKPQELKNENIEVKELLSWTEMLSYVIILILLYYAFYAYLEWIMNVFNFEENGNTPNEQEL